MNAKTVITILLLAFVVGSAAYMIVSEMRDTPIPAENAEPEAAALQDSIPSTHSIAYYFHTTERCMTCRTIESYAYEAIVTGFKDAYDSKKLQWKAVNLDETENEHFIDDYQLHTKSVVLSKIQDGKETQWKNLDRVWDLVNDREEFIAYVQKEAAVFVE